MQGAKLARIYVFCLWRFHLTSRVLKRVVTVVIVKWKSKESIFERKGILRLQTFKKNALYKHPFLNYSTVYTLLFL